MITICGDAMDDLWPGFGNNSRLPMSPSDLCPMCGCNSAQPRNQHADFSGPVCTVSSSAMLHLCLLQSHAAPLSPAEPRCTFVSSRAMLHLRLLQSHPAPLLAAGLRRWGTTRGCAQQPTLCEVLQVAGPTEAASPLMQVLQGGQQRGLRWGAMSSRTRRSLRGGYACRSANIADEA